jgi:hypothetical protein
VFTARYGLYIYVIYIKLAKPSGHYMYHLFNIQQFYVLPTQCIYVLCGSENKQRLFLYAAITDWFLQRRRSVFTARYGRYVHVMYIKPSKPSGHYMYHQCNINNSIFCPHSVFVCFVWISKQTAIISPYSIN